MTALIHPCLHDVMRHSTTVKNDISLFICIYVSRYAKLISYNLSLHFIPYPSPALYSLRLTPHTLLLTLSPASRGINIAAKAKKNRA